MQQQAARVYSNSAQSLADLNLFKEAASPMWAAIKRLDHYRKSVFAMLFIAPALLLYLILAHSSSLFLSEWFLDLITFPMFIGNLISGSTYIGRLFDFANKDFPTDHANPEKPGRKVERILTITGFCIGLAVGIALSFLHFAIPFAATLYGAANAILVLNRISIFAGLGSRIGNCIDQARPKNERKSTGLALIIGIAAGIGLWLGAHATMVSIATTTTLLTSGAALPFWIAGIIFVSTFSNSLAGFADYASKAYNFLTERDPATALGKTIRHEKLHEYRGSFLGVSTGFLIGAVVVTLLVMSNPASFACVAGVAAAALVLATCVCVLGSLFSRVGRLIDGFKQSPAPAPKPAHHNTSTQTITHALQISHPPAPLDSLANTVLPNTTPRKIESPSNHQTAITNTLSNPSPSISPRMLSN